MKCKKKVNKFLKEHSLLQFLISQKLNRAFLSRIDRSLNASISIPTFQTTTVYFDLELLRIFRSRRTVKDSWKWIAYTFRKIVRSTYPYRRFRCRTTRCVIYERCLQLSHETFNDVLLKRVTRNE